MENLKRRSTSCTAWELHKYPEVSGKEVGTAKKNYFLEKYPADEIITNIENWNYRHL
jgi:hypothetical protein